VPKDGKVAWCGFGSWLDWTKLGTAGWAARLFAAEIKIDYRANRGLCEATCQACFEADFDGLRVGGLNWTSVRLCG